MVFLSTYGIRVKGKLSSRNNFEQYRDEESQNGEYLGEIRDMYLSTGFNFSGFIFDRPNDILSGVTLLHLLENWFDICSTSYSDVIDQH